MKPKLEKYDTALLMCTKRHKIELKYTYEIDEDTFKNEEKIFNDYTEIAIAYADSRAIPIDCVRIEHLNKALLDIFEIVLPNRFKELIQEVVNKSSWYQNRTHKEILFLQLYGYLQALTMLDKNSEEIFDLDYSLVLTKE